MLRLLLTSTARPSSRALSAKPNGPKVQRSLARRSIHTKLEQIHHSIIGQDSVVENCAFYYIASTIQASTDKETQIGKDSEKIDEGNANSSDGYLDALVWVASVSILLFVFMREANTRNQLASDAIGPIDAEKDAPATTNLAQAQENISAWLSWISGSY